MSIKMMKKYMFYYKDHFGNIYNNYYQINLILKYLNILNFYFIYILFLLLLNEKELFEYSNLFKKILNEKVKSNIYC